MPAKPGAARRATAVAPPIEKRKPGRPAKMASAALEEPTKATKTATRIAAAPSAPMVSKSELRGQLEKLEQLVSTLRARSRETNKAAKAAIARIANLESHVARLERAAATSAVEPNAAKPLGTRYRVREIDPGDDIPPGVAVQAPAPLDEEAETALANLEEIFGRE